MLPSDFPVQALPPGTRLFHGTYIVEAFLAQGGFGITYRAQEPRLHRKVAIKELYVKDRCERAWLQRLVRRRMEEPETTTEAAADERDYRVVPTGGFALERAQQRFLKEGEILAALRHPGIVPVYGLFPEHDTAYLVMEHVEGETLWQYQKRRGELSVAEVLEIAQQLGAALEAVHAARRETGEVLIHQDVTPRNVLRRRDGSLVLIDFGTARAITDVTGELHTAIYTPGFGALEQYHGEGKRGPYTDVHGLAATVYYLLTGHTPTAALSRSLGTPLRDLKTLRPELPNAIAQAVVYGLALRTENRPQTVSTLLAQMGIPNLENEHRHSTDGIGKTPVGRISGSAGPEDRPGTIPAVPAIRAIPEELRPGEVQINPVDGAAMVWVPAGQFVMGMNQQEIDALWKRFAWPDPLKRDCRHETPAHLVRLTRGFWLYVHPVTVERYRLFCQLTGRAMPPSPPWYSHDDDHPMANLSWYDAQDYCKWSNTRLPTEAEWEYAARGTDKRVFPWGEDSPTRELAGYGHDFRFGRPLAVGHRPKGVSWCGAYDLAGSVWVWCQDWYRPDYYWDTTSRETDPIGPTGGSRKVLRGSSWCSHPHHLRVSSRHSSTPEVRSFGYGIRPVR